MPGKRSTQIFEPSTQAKRPAELHIYEKGGQGFGMRPQNLPVDAWPAAFGAWLHSRGLMSKTDSEVKLSASSVSLVARRFWNSLGQGFSPARRMILSSCVRKF